jgi:hypothetical protein
LEGVDNQEVTYGESALKIIAKPNAGYMFAGWSDGKCQTAERIDKNVTEEIDITANFEKQKRTYTYAYNNATENNERQDIELHYEEENLEHSKNNMGNEDYSLWAEDIPEVWPMLDDYRSVITSFCMGDYDTKLHHVAGIGRQKHASIYLEYVWGSCLKDNYLPIETMLDFDYPGIAQGWHGNIMDLYLHEFAHTVELYFNDREIYEFHDALRYYAYNYEVTASEQKAIRLYLLNQLIIDGKKAGIPNSFWDEEKTYKIIFTDNVTVTRYKYGVPVSSNDTVKQGYGFLISFTIDPGYFVETFIINGFRILLGFESSYTFLWAVEREDLVIELTLGKLD